MINILMVCLGNICRSPLAEGILKSKMSPTKFYIDSAGTSNYHVNSLPDRRSIEVAKHNQIDITNQRARQFSVQDFNTFDFIYVMDNSNYKDVIKLARNKKDINKVRLILNALHPNANMDVPDPYYGGTDGFKNVFKLLNDACQNIANKLNHKS